MGHVEYRCQKEGQFLKYDERQDSFLESGGDAVLDQVWGEEPHCLVVKSDVGSGLRLRKERRINSPILGNLPNGSRLYFSTFPNSPSTDETGRQWLSLEWLNQEPVGFVSVSEKVGTYVNLAMCDV